jgi:hypothetical protein
MVTVANLFRLAGNPTALQTTPGRPVRRRKALVSSELGGRSEVTEPAAMYWHPCRESASAPQNVSKTPQAGGWMTVRRKAMVEKMVDRRAIVTAALFKSAHESCPL